MAIKVIGTNTECEFTQNRNNFKKCTDIDAYHQTLCPISYVDELKSAKYVKDTFAKKTGDVYTIIEYEGYNVISIVKDELEK